MVTLRQIDNSNIEQVIALKVAPEQAQYIASNEKSLNEAIKCADVARIFAIYADEQVVGFAMFAFDENNEDPEDKFWLWRFMIDEAMQGKGYGKAALKEIIKYFMENGADQITLSTKASNEKALALYHKFGFRENGQMNGEEVVLKYECE